MKKRICIASCFWILVGFLLAFAFVTSASSLELKEGNLVRIISVDVDPAKEREFLRWYKSEHEPMLLKVPGVVWNYKARNKGEKGAKYFFMYAHENSDVQKSLQYKAASQTEWAKEIRPYLKGFSAGNYEVIMGGPIPTHLDESDIIRVVKVNVSADKDKEFNSWYEEEHIPMLKEVPGVIAVWRGRNLGDKGQKYLTVYFQEDMGVQKRDDYKKASETNRLKALLPDLSDYSGTNYGILF